MIFCHAQEKRSKKFNIILEMFIWKGILLFRIGKHNVFSDDNFFLMIAWLRRYFILTYILHN